jgi:hypothetical protein
MNSQGGDETNITNSPASVDFIPAWQPVPGPKRSEFNNAARFCQADRDFLGDEAFGNKYGTNGNGANAYGKCVGQNR